MRKISSCSFLFGVSLSVEAAPCLLTLGSRPTENQITLSYTIQSLVTASDQSQYSGSIETELEVDWLNDVVTDFEMTGGLVCTTDATFFFDFGTFGSETIELFNLKATPQSPSGSESLSPPGVFDANLHNFEFNQGQVVVTGDFGEGERGVSDEPFIAAGLTTGQIELSERVEHLSTLTGEPVRVDYRADFTLDLDSNFSSDESGLLIEGSTTGLIIASGPVEIPTSDFHAWFFEHSPSAGFAVSFSTDGNQDGVADGLTWAAGFSAGSRNLGFWSVDSLSQTLSFEPDTAGTRMPIMVEMNKGLEPDDWEEVPAGWVSSGQNPIVAGASGLITITPSSESRAFFRLKVQD